MSSDKRNRNGHGHSSGSSHPGNPANAGGSASHSAASHAHHGSNIMNSADRQSSHRRRHASSSEDPDHRTRIPFLLNSSSGTSPSHAPLSNPARGVRRNGTLRFPCAACDKRYVCALKSKASISSEYALSRERKVSDSCLPSSTHNTPFTLSCTLSFTQRSDVRKHQKTVHDKQRDHLCTECGLSFGERGNLNKVRLRAFWGLFYALFFSVIITREPTNKSPSDSGIRLLALRYALGGVLSTSRISIRRSAILSAKSVNLRSPSVMGWGSICEWVTATIGLMGVPYARRASRRTAIESVTLSWFMAKKETPVAPVRLLIIDDYRIRKCAPSNIQYCMRDAGRGTWGRRGSEATWTWMACETNNFRSVLSSALSIIWLSIVKITLIIMNVLQKMSFINSKRLYFPTQSREQDGSFPVSASLPSPGEVLLATTEICGEIHLNIIKRGLL